jgi:hypothetical protein
MKFIGAEAQKITAALETVNMEPATAARRHRKCILITFLDRVNPMQGNSNTKSSSTVPSLPGRDVWLQ